MRVALQKLPGTEIVDVSLERALVVVRLRQGNTVTLAQVRDIIKRNGFTSREAAVTVVGTLADRGGSPALEVSGTSAVLTIAADPKSPQAFDQIDAMRRSGTNQPVELTGMVMSSGDQQDRITVQTVR